MSITFNAAAFERELVLARGLAALPDDFMLQLAADSLAKASTPEPFSTSKTVRA